MMPEIALSLEPEELGAHLLMALKRIARPDVNQGKVHLGNSYSAAMAEIVEGWKVDAHLYSAGAASGREDLRRAFTEAWTWLELQGLLVPSTGMNGSSGWRVLSRRASRFSDPADFIPFRVARMLDRDMLNLRIREEVWAAFIRGHFEVAAGIAMQAVEVAVREACEWGHERSGQPMLAQAFDPDSGPLADTNSLSAERKGVRDLFIGAFAAHRNPRAHRRVTMDDAAEVIEVVLLANHLLRIVDRAVARRAAAAGGADR